MISASEATTALTSALKAFNLTAEDAIKVVDKLTKIDQLAAVSAGGISQALQKSANSAKLAGMSMDELIGSVSVIGEVTQQSMDTVGNAMKSILARYGNVKAGVFTSMGLNDDGETTENINDIEKVLRKLGIQVRTSATEMRGITDVLDDVSEKWDAFDTVTKNAIATAFGGTRMRENFLVLMENWDRVKELTEESANAVGSADKKYESVMESMETATKKLEAAWESLSTKFETSPFLIRTTKLTAGLVENLDKIITLFTTIYLMQKRENIFGFVKNTWDKKGEFFGRLVDNKVSGKVTYDENGKMILTKGDDTKLSIISRAIKPVTQAINSNGNNTTSILQQLLSVVQQINLKTDAKGKIVSGLTTSTNKPAYYDGIDANGNPIFKYSGNHHKITNPNEISNLQKQKDTIDQYNASLGTPAATDQISSYKTTWRGNKAKSFTIGDTQYSLDKSGNYMASEQQTINGITIHKQRALTADEQKQVGELNEALGEQKFASMKSGALMGGITGAISAITTKKNIGEKDLSASGIAASIFNPTDQQITETTGDKIGRVAATAAGGAIGGAIGGPLGAMVGQMIGEFGASMVSTLIHRSELEMKQRVADAKENLQALNSIQQSIENNAEILTKSFLESDDYKELKKFTENLRETFKDYKEEEKDNFLKYFKQDTGLSEGEKGILSKLDNITTVEDICSKIENGNADERKLIKKQLEIATARQTAENLYKSQEEDRTKYSDIIKGALKFTGESTVDKALKKLDKNAELTDFTGSFSKELIPQLKDAIKQWNQLNAEVKAAYANIGFLSANIHDLSDSELGDLTMDGVIGRVVEALEAFGYGVRTDAGYIDDQYLTAIKNLIKSDSKFTSLFKGETKTLKEMQRAAEKFNKTTVESLGEADKQALEKLSINTGELANYWNQLYDLAQRGKLSEELTKLVYAANPERIENFARAWRLTNDQLDEFAKKYPDLTTAIGLMKPSEVREYYGAFIDIWSDLAEDSRLTAENFEKILTQYPQLLKYYRESGGEMSGDLLFKMEEEQKQAYINSLINEEFGDKGVYSELKKQVIDAVKSGEGAFGVDKKILASLQDVIEKYGTIDELISEIVRLQNEGTDASKNQAANLKTIIDSFVGYDREIEWESPLLKIVKQAQITQLEQVIEKLTEQKEALTNLNDERKKEIELIKAKNALENAKKEKKRVYRSGIGWTYESDTTAISEAQDKLESLDIERQQEVLQYQIDQYEVQKQILESLDSKRQEAAYKNALDAWAKQNGVDKNGLGNLTSAIVYAASNGKIKYNPSTDGSFNNVITAREEEVKTAMQNVKNSTAGWLNENKGELETSSNSASDSDEDWNIKRARLQDAVTKAREAGATDEQLKKYQDWLDKNPEKNILTDTGIGNGDIHEGVFNSILTDSKIGWHQITRGLQSIYINNDNNKEYGMYFDKVQENSTGLTPEQLSNFKQGDLVKMLNRYFVRGQNGDVYEISPNVVKQTTIRGSDNIPKVTNVEGVSLDDVFKYLNDEKNAQGTLSFQGGPSLINELGTEGIITPEGTYTALPSKTGIVPADITKNVWALGEVAPTLIAQLRSITQGAPTGTAGNTTYEEGQYFDNFTMNVYPTKDYDMDKLLMEARAKMRLTRHNN